MNHEHEWQRSVMKDGAVWVICRRCGRRDHDRVCGGCDMRADQCICEMPGPGYDAQTRPVRSDG